MAGPAEPAGLPGALTGLGRCLVMGVLNVTPDSFSDGGRWLDPDAAVRRGLELMASGADLLDVGGESTRPGATRPDEQEELRRVLPVVRELADAGAAVSVDTMRAVVADACLDAGAAVVNDVSGGLADPDMVRVLAGSDAPYVLMHWRGHSHDMERHASYDDPVGEVREELSRRLDAVVSAGVEVERVVLDPGLGFAKRAPHDWALLAGLGELATLGRPLLVGASRKRFVGAVLAGPDGVPRPVDEREHATTALTALAAAAGAWAVRVHEPGPSADAVRVAAAWTGAGAPPSDDPASDDPTSDPSTRRTHP